MEWILVVLIHAGVMSKGDSVTMTTLPGWGTEQACEEAGRSMKPLVEATFKEMRYVCVKKE